MDNSNMLKSSLLSMATLVDTIVKNYSIDDFLDIREDVSKTHDLLRSVGLKDPVGKNVVHLVDLIINLKKQQNEKNSI